MVNRSGALNESEPSAERNDIEVCAVASRKRIADDNLEPPGLSRGYSKRSRRPEKTPQSTQISQNYIKSEQISVFFRRTASAKAMQASLKSLCHAPPHPLGYEPKPRPKKPLKKGRLPAALWHIVLLLSHDTHMLFPIRSLYLHRQRQTGREAGTQSHGSTPILESTARPPKGA